MQSASSRIWTRVAVFISYDDNHYTTGTMDIVMEVEMEAAQMLLVQLVLVLLLLFF